MLQWITKALGCAPRSGKPARVSARPWLERLESRYTPVAGMSIARMSPVPNPVVSYTVANLNDTGLGSLRAAIDSANAASGTQFSIDFANTLNGTIALGSQLPALAKNIDINGPGSSMIAIAGSGGAGGASFRLFEINAGMTCSITNLTLRDGYLEFGGGGAISNNGHLLLSGLEIHSNHAGGNGGALYNGPSGSLSITGCDIRLNDADVSGGAIWNGSELHITDSRIYSNTAGSGGGISNQSDGVAYLSDVELYSNTSGGNGGGVLNHGTFDMSGGMLYLNSANDDGGGIYVTSGSADFSSVAANSNSANRGGAFYLTSGSISFAGGSLTGNSSGSNALMNGGGYDSVNGSCTLDPSVELPDSIDSF